jgi:uncharacterized protein (DUF362 family)
MWMDSRYVEADWLISVASMKTHWQAGVTGAVKNVGIGATPAAKYSAGASCARTQTPEYIDHTVPATNKLSEPLSQFIRDFYSARPVDFAVIDGLQGMQHGPSPIYVPNGDYEKDKMNMRLIVASRNAVAADTIETQVMGCDPSQVPHLTMLEKLGLGTTDASKIDVVGNTTVAAARKPFAGPMPPCTLE